MHSRLQVSVFRAALCFSVFLPLNIFQSLANSVLISNTNGSTSFYLAPRHYSISSGMKRPLQSFIITSKPLNFQSDTGNEDRETSPRLPALPTRNKISFTNIPGVATVVCKGSSCANSTLSFAETAMTNDGFAGEAIPINNYDEYFTVLMSDKKKQETALPPLKPSHLSLSKLPAASASVVSLLTQRPYLQQGSSKRRKTETKSTTLARRRATTPIRNVLTTTTTTVRPPPARRRTPAALLASPSPPTTKKPAANINRIPTITLGRPSMFFPAAAAFTLMALPVAAAAVPILLSATGRRKRRSVTFPVDKMAHNSDFKPSQADFYEILINLNSMEHGNDSKSDMPHVLQRHLNKARHRVQHAQKHLEYSDNSNFAYKYK